MIRVACWKCSAQNVRVRVDGTLARHRIPRAFRSQHHPLPQCPGSGTEHVQATTEQVVQRQAHGVCDPCRTKGKETCYCGMSAEDIAADRQAKRRERDRLRQR